MGKADDQIKLQLEPPQLLTVTVKENDNSQVQYWVLGLG